MSAVPAVAPVRIPGVAVVNDDRTIRPATEPTSAKDRAYAAVRGGILDGTFTAGSFIQEAQICDLAKVSRTPVREALNRLAQEGLIDLYPRRGAMVRHVTGRELQELYEARRLIEGHAVAGLCRDRRPAPPQMAALQVEMARLTADDVFHHVELNRRFHRLLVESCGNHVLIRMYAGLQVSVTRVSMSALSLDLARQATIHAEHLELLTAIDAHDVERALAVLGRHLHPLPQLVSRLPG